MPIAAVVADANVLLSATVGKAALRVIVEHGIEVHAAEFNAAEVVEYIPRLCHKFGLPEDLVELQWRILPLVIHPERDYIRHLPWARSRLVTRDLDDAHPLALARALRLPLWSNDRDLVGHGIDCHTTASLLRTLEDRK